MKHKLLFLLVALLSTMTAWAGKNFEVDGLQYWAPNEDQNIVQLFRCSASPTGALLIPATVNNDGQDYVVATIEPGVFRNCKDLTSVSFAEGSQLTSIGKNAFEGCTGLTSITIPASVTTIGASAFSGCSGLTSIVIPEGVTSIDYGAFYDCI